MDTTELWIATEVLHRYWDELPEEFRESIQVRAEFDLQTKERIKMLFKEIAMLKQEGFENKNKK